MPLSRISTARASSLTGRPAANCALYAASCSLVVLDPSLLKMYARTASRLCSGPWPALAERDNSPLSQEAHLSRCHPWCAALQSGGAAPAPARGRAQRIIAEAEAEMAQRVTVAQEDDLTAARRMR